jgi:hypothetical protein
MTVVTYTPGQLVYDQVTRVFRTYIGEGWSAVSRPSDWLRCSAIQGEAGWGADRHAMIRRHNVRPASPEEVATHQLAHQEGGL